MDETWREETSWGTKWRRKNLGETRVERVERKNENKRNETKKKDLEETR